MRKTAPVAAALAVLITAALAAHFQKSVAGAWAGPVLIKHDGKTEEDFVHVVLRLNAAELTGTAGPDADHQFRIAKGKVATVDGITEVTFEFIANGSFSSYKLKLVGDLLKGEARIEGEDGQPRTASVELRQVTTGHDRLAPPKPRA